MVKVAYVGSLEVLKVGYKQILTSFGFEVECLDYSPDLRERLALGDFHHVILDQGVEITSEGILAIEQILVNDERDFPVMVIADIIHDDAKIELYRIGITGCIARPRDLREVVYLIRAITLLNNKGFKPLKFRDFSIVKSKAKIYYKNTELNLTFIEYKMLSSLLFNKGRPIERDIFLQDIWGDNQVSKGTVFTHTGNVSEKIKESGIKVVYRQKLGFFLSEENSKPLSDK